MKCFCYDAGEEFVFCVEDVENTRLEDAIQHAAWKKSDGKFLLACQQGEFADDRDKKRVSENFARLGQAVFESMLAGFDWEKPLDMIAREFNEGNIEWYIVGSVCDVARGVHVKPHDMDIVVHTRDFQKAKDICYSHFYDAVIFPFSETQKICPLRCFGRMFLSGGLVEIAADENWNSENRRPTYEKAMWNGHDVNLESFQLRYQIEMSRKREDRIKAFNECMGQGKQ